MIQVYLRVAQEVASCGGPQLDKKQYISYEINYCTFLLGLIHSGVDMTPSFHGTLCGVFDGYKDAAKVGRLLEN